MLATSNSSGEHTRRLLDALEREADSEQLLLRAVVALRWADGETTKKLLGEWSNGPDDSALTAAAKRKSVPPAGRHYCVCRPAGGTDFTSHFPPRS